MDLFTIIGASLRRWYVSMPLAALAAFGAFQAYEAVPSVYSSSVSIAVLPSGATLPEPADPDAPVPENPYSGSGGPRFAAAVLARNINTAGYRDRAGLGDAEGISFEASPASQQPIIRIDATGPTPEAVLAALDALTAQAGVVLSEFQLEAGAPEALLYRIALAVPADQVEDVTPSRFRSAGAILVMGLALAAAAATAVDGIARRRRDARVAEADAAPEQDGGASEPGTSSAEAPEEASARSRGQVATPRSRGGTAGAVGAAAPGGAGTAGGGDPSGEAETATVGAVRR